MKIFLSALENGSTCFNSKKPLAVYLKENGVNFKWNLMSFFYIPKSKYDLASYIRDNSELILIDSGAHSFQFGKKVNWIEYTERYAEFIKTFDRPNVVGYFEMDIENIIGYEKVKELRKILESVSNKIIPVWHPLRGINDYEAMCEQYSGRVIAIGGFRGTDIKDDQFLSFIKVARKYGCKVHCLGMTRADVLKKVPFDYTDSSTWKQHGIHGVIDGRGKVTKAYSKEHREDVFLENYKTGMKMQEYFYKLWRKECKD